LKFVKKGNTGWGGEDRRKTPQGNWTGFWTVGVKRPAREESSLRKRSCDNSPGKRMGAVQKTERKRPVQKWGFGGPFRPSKIKKEMLTGFRTNNLMKVKLEPHFKRVNIN